MHHNQVSRSAIRFEAKKRFELYFRQVNRPENPKQTMNLSFLTNHPAMGPGLKPKTLSPKAFLTLPFQACSLCLLQCFLIHMVRDTTWRFAGNYHHMGIMTHSPRAGDAEDGDDERDSVDTDVADGKDDDYGDDAEGSDRHLRRNNYNKKSHDNAFNNNQHHHRSSSKSNSNSNSNGSSPASMR